MRKPLRPRPQAPARPDDAARVPGRRRASTAGTADSGDSAGSASSADSAASPRTGRTGTAPSAASARSSVSAALGTGAPSAGTPELPPRRESQGAAPGPRSLAVFGRGRRSSATSATSADGALVRPASGGDRVVSSGLTDRLEERRRSLRALRVRRALGALGVLVLVAALVWGLLFSPLLALRTSDVSVKGSDGTVTAAQVRKVLEADAGTSILRLSTGAQADKVTQALVRVRSARVSRSPLHGLTVTLTMRVPVAAQQTDAGWRVMDGDGVVLETATDQPSGVVVIAATDGRSTLSGGQVKAVVKAVGALDKSTRAQVAQGTASSAGQVTLTLTSGATVVWGDSSESALKARVLAILLKQGAQTYDVSSPRTPTTS